MSHAATIDHHHDVTTSTGIPNKKLFMWAFLASDCMFFGALISTHLIYRLHPPPGSPDVSKIFSIELTSFSTFILLMSSLLMALAVNSLQKGHVRSTRHNLLGTIFFGLIFLGCQVYEFNHFVHEKGLTLSNSIFGSTFYTLTGTHGCHVAIGVLWLVLMYIRSFKPADPSRSWLARAIAHFVVFTITTVAGTAAVLGLVHTIQSHESLSVFIDHHLLATSTTVIGLALLTWFGFSRKPVDFGEANAIDVESMGLYWHFVDIVWIVIFTVVYLLEYL
ncbi:MAG: heme-copper oxidase subunit III [Verrucomicrobia bacterium]|nr:heme-copper oxidase subunit III [Verrucomicrobiota bacterium]